MAFSRLYIAPKASTTTVDTGLRFTDILFGFVIRELFLRLQHWSDLSWPIRWQLIVGTILVLGSWIGFRRSLNRADYELKFFNLPLFRFLLDQGMVLLYFRVATLTSDNPTEANHANVAHVSHNTVKFVLVIFGLYLLWDALGMWMAKNYGKYPKRGPSDEEQPEKTHPDWWGFSISVLCTVLAGGLYFGAVERTNLATGHHAGVVLVLTGVLLVLYRWLKELRTTYRELHPLQDRQLSTAAGVEGRT